MRLPDYQGGGIVNLMASLQQGLGGPVHAYAPLQRLPVERVREHRQVLLWVIDGLGLNYLVAHPDEAACLNAHLAGGMTSVYPPTTATAVTTYLTGDAPQQHGLTGWHMYLQELGSVMAVLPGRARYGGCGWSASGIDVAALFAHRPFADRIAVPSHNFSPAAIAGSDFNRAHLGRAQWHSYQDLADLMTQSAEVLRQDGERFVYAYWSELDGLGHRKGIWSAAAQGHLRELDQAFETLLHELRGSDTLVVVCADHGQIDTTPADRIVLDDHPALAELLAQPLCGEPRSAYCYLRPGCEAAFDAYVLSEFAGKARSHPGAEVIRAGWFGLGDPHPRLARRVGDRVLLMQEHFVLKDWLAQERRFEMIGVHGGLSDDELLVPLVLAAA